MCARSFQVLFCERWKSYDLGKKINGNIRRPLLPLDLITFHQLCSIYPGIYSPTRLENSLCCNFSIFPPTMLWWNTRKGKGQQREKCPGAADVDRNQPVQRAYVVLSPCCATRQICSSSHKTSGRASCGTCGFRSQLGAPRTLKKKREKKKEKRHFFYSISKVSMSSCKTNYIFNNKVTAKILTVGVFEWNKQVLKCLSVKFWWLK